MSHIPPRPFPVYPKRPLKHGGGARIMIARKPYYLGQHGSPASYAEYDRLRLAHASGGLKSTAQQLRNNSATISDLIAAWIQADKRGKAHKEVIHTSRAARILESLWGLTAAKEFNAMRLEDVQAAMLAKEWARGYINAQLARVVRIFKWAERKGIVPPGTWQHLKTVEPIRKNDRRARSTAARKPCDWERQVVPALARMYPQVAAMVQVQFYGGMRPAEVVTMRRSEVDQDGPQGCWLYRPSVHKTTYRGDELTKVLGPQAQAVLLPWLLKAEPDGFVFPPVRNRAGRGRFSVESYHQAVLIACEEAGVERFVPYQLRHLAKLTATRAFGLDAARAFLGQLSIGATAMYSRQQDLESAAEVARKIG